MNKMWNCVYSYAGVYSDQRIFEKKEDAEKWFDRIVGNPDDFDESDYEYEKTDDIMYYHEDNERHPVDVSCLLVVVE